MSQPQPEPQSPPHYNLSPWPLKDIIYTSIVGAVMTAGFLEWFLWLGAWLYCLFKAFIKADHYSTKIVAVVIACLFSSLRLVFLPVMIVTLPLPDQITQYFPGRVVAALQSFGFVAFLLILTVPFLMVILHLVTKRLGRKKRLQEVLDEYTAPKILVVMPVYREDLDTLITAVDSVVSCDYPASCIHVFLSFDGDKEDKLYLQTLERLGVPLLMKSYPKSIDVTYLSARITISRFPHGGKRSCQKSTFKLIDRVYTEYIQRHDDLFILFIDSDCILDRVCLQNFVYDMHLSPGNKRQMLAMTGVITSTTKKHSMITLLQDMEYVHGQLFERTVESGCGSVTCLPGALTMLRYSAFRTMAKYYFADKAEACSDMFDYWKCHLGEDRWLTHLFMVGAKQRFQIQMCTSAFCKTEAVQTFSSLVKQRRRWFLGFITNEVCMLTDIRLWRRYPALCLLRFLQNTIRTTSLLFFIMVISLITTSKTISNLPVGFIGISLGLNWAMMIYFGIVLKRYKVWAYPLMFILNPFLNWYYMVYGIFTAGKRTWGGPRADAGAADVTKTAQEVIEEANQLGDDLNIIPETFKEAARAQNHSTTSVPLLPPDRLEGRFAAAEWQPGGWYQHADDSLVSVGAATSLHGPRESSLSRKGSYDSTKSLNSVISPHQVESLMNEEDRRKYAIAQSFKKTTRGSFVELPQGRVYEMSEAEMVKEGFKETEIESAGSSVESLTPLSAHPNRPSIRSPLWVSTNSDDEEDKEVDGNVQRELEH